MTDTPELRRPEAERMSRPLAEVDPEVADALNDEVRRQATGLELIASENFISEAVMEAMGSVFSNKYAEGYPGKRYYGGCENVDRVERLAIERAKQLFELAKEQGIPTYEAADRLAERRIEQVGAIQRTWI